MRKTLLLSALTFIVLLALAGVAWAQDRPTCWLVVGDSGRPSAIATRGGPALADAGFDVASRAQGQAPDVVVLFPRAVNSLAELSVIEQLVKEGAGLVFIYSLAPDLRVVTDRVLADWHVALKRAQLSSTTVSVEDHPITRGVDKLFVWRVPATLDGVKPLLRQGPNIIAGYSTRGGNRLVVLPLDAVVPGQAGDVVPPPNLKLLVQAATWAAHAKPPAHKPPVVEIIRGEETTLPTGPPEGRGEYRRIAYFDMKADNEDWPQLREAVESVVKAAGFDIADVRVRRPKEHRKSDNTDKKEEKPEQRSLPLIRALKDAPGLVVVGSCREFDAVEAVALGTYVRAGGALLVLPHATNRTNMRLVNVNKILTEFGMAVTLGRGSGEGDVASTDLTADLGEISKLPGGVLIVGYRGVGLVQCREEDVVRVLQDESGRMAVADPMPLLRKYADEKTTAAWAKLLSRLVNWLTEGMEYRGE